MGAISLPQMRALHKYYGEIAVDHVDPHTAAWPAGSNTSFTNANAAIKHARDMGYEVISIGQYYEIGVDKVAPHIHQLVADRPAFICYDMDFFDPALVPDLATPTPGGAMPSEGIILMRRLKGLNIVGIDINTTTPLHDPIGASANLAATLIAEAIGNFS